MKTRNILFLCGVGLMGLVTSCESDSEFLTEHPKSVLTIENAYNNSSQVLATLMSAYNQYAGFFFPGEWGVSEFVYKCAGTDIWDGNDQMTHYSNFTSYWATDAGFVKEVWDRYYKMISYCNLALGQIDNVSWDKEADRTNLMAEAHFLRGLAYLRLAEYYGGVPLITEFSDQPRFDYVRTPRADVYQQAIADMMEGYNHLPETALAYGRVSKSAAALYLSEAYMALGVEKNDNSQFETAAKYALEVTQKHPLMTSRFGVRIDGATGASNGIPNAFPEGNVMSDLFVSANIISPANTEAIWVMPSCPDYATYSANGGYRENALNFTPAVQDINWADEYAEAGAGMGPWKVVSEKYGGATNPAIHGAYTWALTPLTWFTSYDMWDEAHNGTSADYRYVEGVTVRTKLLVTDPNHSLYEQYIGWEYIDKNNANTASKYFPFFYKETPLDKWDYDPNCPGFFGQICHNYRNKYAARSSEAYLLLAEAYLRLGKTQQAKDALQTVRSRANASELSDIDMQVILDERARELLFEEDRWATLLRMKPEEWKQRITNYGMYSQRGNTPKYPEVRRWSEYTGDIKFNNWPIPLAYIDLNKEAEMTQNEGWK